MLDFLKELLRPKPAADLRERFTAFEGCTEAEGLYFDKSLGLWRLGELPE